MGGEASGNVAMDGMFSIQVLSRALESWGLTVMSLESEEARDLKAAPTTAEAFICNLQEHWFTLRRVADGEWWNFNSLFPAPQPLSTFYLTAFLDTLRDEGWTIFVIRGKLPATQPGGLETLPNAGKWWSSEDARAATDEAERTRKRGRVTNALETALARAGEQGGSLQLRTRGAPAAAAAGGGDDDDADLAAAIAASLHQSGAAGAGPGPGSLAAAAGGGGGPAGPGLGAPAGDAALGHGHGLEEFEDEDPELAMAIAASLADQAGPAGAAAGEAHAGAGPGTAAAGGSGGQAALEPETPAVELLPEPEEGAEGAIELAFRLPSGGRCSRRFLTSQPAACVAAYLAPQLGVPPGRVVVATQFPRKELQLGADTPLSDLGLTHRTMLLAEARK